MKPEAKARVKIDKMLLEAGYVLQDKKFHRTASRGVAVRECRTNSGPADYVLFVDGIPVGVVEAKAENVLLGGVAEQSRRYAESGLKDMPEADIRFAYESNAIHTRFRDRHDKKPCSREVFSFHRPETLAEWLKEEETLRNRLKALPEFW